MLLAAPLVLLPLGPQPHPSNTNRCKKELLLSKDENTEQSWQCTVPVATRLGVPHTLMALGD